MDIKINAQFDSKAIERQLEGISRRRWPRILKFAAFNTGRTTLKHIQSEMPKYIDKPKPYTINSMTVKRGRGNDIDATVQWKDGFSGNTGGKYLRAPVLGGERQAKGFERLLQARGLMPANTRAVPTDAAPRDAFGNVPGPYIVRILSYLRALNDPLQNRRYGVVGKKVKKKDKQFFAVPAQQGKLSPGIYERRYFGFVNTIRKIFGYVNGVKYKKTFPFYDIGQAKAREVFSDELNKEIEQSIKFNARAGT